MKKPLQLFILFALLLSLLTGIAGAETEKDGFHFDDNGFLAGDANPIYRQGYFRRGPV